MQKQFTACKIFGHLAEPCKPFKWIHFVSPVSHFAAGSSHMAMLMQNSAQQNHLICIGSNSKGQCGLQHGTLKRAPTEFAQFANAQEDDENVPLDACYEKTTHFVQVACGADFTLALHQDLQTIFACGYNNVGQVNVI